jgi:hypothetical protein
MSIYCHNPNDYTSGKSPKTWGIKNRPLLGPVYRFNFYLLIGAGAYPPNARMYWVGLNYFFVK